MIAWKSQIRFRTFYKLKVGGVVRKAANIEPQAISKIWSNCGYAEFSLGCAHLSSDACIAGRAELSRVLGMKICSGNADCKQSALRENWSIKQ